MNRLLRFNLQTVLGISEYEFVPMRPDLANRCSSFATKPGGQNCGDQSDKSNARYFCNGSHIQSPILSF